MSNASAGLPWGNGFNAYEGDILTFNNSLVGNEWTSTIARNDKDTVTNTFALGKYAATFDRVQDS